MQNHNANGKDGEWFQLTVPNSEVEIATVLSCGQSFRWKNDGPDSDEWIGVYRDYLWVLKQVDDTQILYKVIGNPQLSNDEYNKLLWKYFQLDISLPNLYQEWSKKDPKLFANLANTYKGIRILEQEPIENIFSFICSAANNIKRISQMVEKMCIFYGEPIGELYGKTYHTFPRVENLSGSKVEKKLREEMFGYRAAYIANSATKIVENGGHEWAESLKKLSYDEAYKELQTLPGIGRKVADCICLMSLGFHNSIPVDTHIHQLGKQYLPHLSKMKSLTDKGYSEISEHFRKLFGSYSGWAQSVLFASTLRHLKSDNVQTANKRKNVNTKIETGDDDDSGLPSNLVEVAKPSSVKTKSTTAKVIEAEEDLQRANKNISTNKISNGSSTNGRSGKRRKI